MSFCLRFHLALLLFTAALPARARPAAWDWVPEVGEISPEILGAGTLGVLVLGVVALMRRRGARRGRSRRPTTRPAPRSLAISDTAELSDRLTRELAILSDTIGRLATSVKGPGGEPGRREPAAGGQSLGSLAGQLGQAKRLLTPKGETSGDEGLWLSRAEEAVGKLEALSEEASALQNLLTTLGELSDRTQLLAINAAIEAAKAGESGRGLARVADDVRLMARDSRHAGRRLEQVMGETARSGHELRELLLSGAALYRAVLIRERRKDRQAGEAAHLVGQVHGELDKAAGAASTGGGLQAPVEPELAGVLAELHGAAEQLAGLSARLNSAVRRPRSDSPSDDSLQW